MRETPESYILYAASKGYKNVCIKTPDSEIFFILLHSAKKAPINILLDTKIKGKARLIDVKTIAGNLGQEKCSSLLGLHGYTGSDTTSAFRVKGELNPLKKM